MSSFAKKSVQIRLAMRFAKTGKNFIAMVLTPWKRLESADA